MKFSIRQDQQETILYLLTNNPQNTPPSIQASVSQIRNP